MSGVQFLPSPTWAGSALLVVASPVNAEAAFAAASADTSAKVAALLADELAGIVVLPEEAEPSVVADELEVTGLDVVVALDNGPWRAALLRELELVGVAARVPRVDVLGDGADRAARLAAAVSPVAWDVLAFVERCAPCTSRELRSGVRGRAWRVDAAAEALARCGRLSRSQDGWTVDPSGEHPGACPSGGTRPLRRDASEVAAA